MKSEELDRLMAATRPIVSEHWADCLEFALDGHSEIAHSAVDKALAKYFEALKALPQTASPAEILDVMKRLFANLDRINLKSDGALLETDERELLVPMVISAAEIAGLSLDQLEGDDPTLEFRNF